MWFPSPDQIIRLHDRLIEETGGERGVLNRSAVEAAVERARWGPFLGSGSLAERAAFLLRGIVQDHPFVDGNKRTGLAAAAYFLARNGQVLVSSPDDTVRFMLRVAEGRFDVEAIEEWIEYHSENL